MSKTANRTFSVLFYIDADIAPLDLYRQHLCNSGFILQGTFFIDQNIMRYIQLF